MIWLATPTFEKNKVDIVPPECYFSQKLLQNILKDLCLAFMETSYSLITSYPGGKQDYLKNTKNSEV